MEVEDYLAKIDIDKILYVNKIPLNKIVLESIPSYNPMTMQYRDFWTKETEKCIDGFWVEHEGKWKYVPGALYFYGTHWHILLNEKGSKSKTKKIARPMIRDLEWIKFYLYIEARGFSGFEEDDEYSCHRELSLPEEERTMEFIGQSCYNKKGKLKKYVPAREYLYKYHSKPLGKPVFENMALNVVDVESRGTGKSFTMSSLGGLNFTFDGAQDFEEYWNLRKTEAKLSSETLIGAIDSKYSDDLIKKMKLGLDSFKGEYVLGRKSTPPPFSKGYAGQWIAGKTIIQEVEVKEGGRWKKKGSRSKIQHRTFMDNEFAANGTRASFNVLDEIGFFYNLIPTLGQMKECTADGALKFGTIWMCVCEGTKVWTKEGNLVNIEDLKQEDGIIGWDKGKSVPTTISKMYPPTPKDCVRITTNKGTILECSNDHPVLWTKNGWTKKVEGEPINGKRTRISAGRKKIWKDAGDIKKGDQILAAEEVGIFGNTEVWNPRLLGLLVGDGSYGFDKTPVLSNCDSEINDYIEENFDTVTERSYITKNNKVYKETRIKNICRHLKDEKIYGQTKGNKTLPPNIHVANKKSVEEFLAGFYDADGTIYVGKKAQIHLDSAYKSLLEEVKLLLRKLGIHSYLKYCKPNFKNPIDRSGWYRLSICDARSLVKFSESIPCIVKHKRENLAIILDKYKNAPIRKPEGIEGLRIESVVSVEKIGKKNVYNLTADGHHTYLANGIVTHNTGTGGDMEGGSTEAVMRVFYDPITYDCVPFNDNYEGSGKQIGFFIPAWMGLNQFKDDLGNTNYKSAIQYILNVRKKLSKGKDRKAYDDELSQRPIFPSEVFLISGGNILPTGMLKDQLQNLETTTTPEDEGVLGHMKLNPEGKPEFVVDIDGALQECDWPVKKGVDNTGAVRVWEQPAENAGFGYYLAGIDPYDQDKAPNSVSLGSLIIMKRASPGVSPYDFIVAEYTGRPETAKEFYEQCRLLLFWYGIVGTCLYENEKIGIKTYFENNNCLHLLAPTPSILKSNITSNVNRQIGQHMSSKVKDEAEIMLRDWLVAPAGDGKLNLHNIKSKPILKELINYNKIGNFDRVISLMLCVIQMTQMYKIVTDTKEEEFIDDDPFFSRPLFQHSVFGGGFNNVF